MMGSGTGDACEFIDPTYFLIQPIDDEEKLEEDLEWECPIYFSQVLHKYTPSNLPYETNYWKPLEKKKTVYVALVMCLHVGVDPPDIMRPSPCARLECWQNPLQIVQPKPAEVIGNALHQQYERMQQRARYKILTDPVNETVSKACLQLRKNAKDDRVLFHYNGHGVPKPTANGEIWVFNKNFTQYMPMCVLDVNKWLQGPTMYVFDCSNAGMIIDTFKNICLSNDPNLDLIYFGACGRDEILPMNPELPADLFTSCLTTPIKIALRWYCLQNPECLPPGITMESTDNIPGKTTDRRTPLGELYWIFTAVTDTIGWSVLPVSMFQRLFRQDNLIAGLSRNFLLAARILKSYNCTPCSEPEFPEDCSNHPMWKAWDMVCDMCVKQLPYLLAQDSKDRREYVFSGFFSEQLKAFEIFLNQIRTNGYDKPNLLPIVLQVLLAQNHRPRALELLKQFLDIDVRAVMSAMSVGVFPYIARLLSTPSTATPDTLPSLLCIYAKIIALDPSFYSSLEMTKIVYINCFKEILCSQSSSFGPFHKTLAVYIISRLLNHVPEARAICAEDKQHFIPTCEQLLYESDYPLLHMWIIICLASLWKNCDAARRTALRTNILDVFIEFLSSPHEELRTAVLCALGTFVQNSNVVKEETANNTLEGSRSASSARLASTDAQMNETDQKIAYQIIKLQFDVSEMVRKELAVALAHFVLENEAIFQAKWKQFSNSLSPEARGEITGTNSSPSGRGKESFCIVNGHDTDNLAKNSVKSVPVLKQSRTEMRDLDSMSSSDEFNITVNVPNEDSAPAANFHIGTPPNPTSAKKFPQSNTVGRNALTGNSPAPGLKSPKMLAPKRNDSTMALTHSETTVFKDIWDTLISLFNDPCGLVSDTAKQVLKRISGSNKPVQVTQAPRSILRSDSCTQPQSSNSLIPHSSNRRKKGNSCDDPTATTSRLVLVEEIAANIEANETKEESSEKPSVTFNLHNDETHYYYKENPAGYFCTGFIEEYSQMMLEPFHKWPFSNSPKNLSSSTALGLSLEAAQDPKDLAFYNIKKLHAFKRNATWRLKTKSRNNIPCPTITPHLEHQELIQFSQILSSRNTLKTFHFEPYESSLSCIGTSSLFQFDYGTRQQKLCFEESWKEHSNVMSNYFDYRYLDVVPLSSHEKALTLIAKSCGSFKILKSRENDQSDVERWKPSSSHHKISTSSTASNSTLMMDVKSVLCSFRGFRVPPSQPLGNMCCSWNKWTGKFLACAKDVVFDFNLNSKSKNCVRVWDFHTQKAEYERETMFEVTRCLSHHDLDDERQPNFHHSVHYYGLTNGTIQILDTRLIERNRTLFREHMQPISYLASYADYNLVSAAENIKVWDLRKPHSVITHKMPEQSNRATRVTVSNTFGLFAISHSKTTYSVIDLCAMDSGKILNSVKLQPQSSSILASKHQFIDVKRMEFHPHKPIFAVASKTGTIYLYSIDGTHMQCNDFD